MIRLTKIIILACSYAVLGNYLSNPLEGMAQSSGPKIGARPISKIRQKGSASGFKSLGGVGEIETKSGLRLGFADYVGSDGVKLSLLYLAENNRALSLQAYNEELSRAVKIVAQSKKTDGNGVVVGERAQILLPGRRFADQFPVPAVIWTDGPTFHEISSSSVDDILKLEKEYRY